MLQDEGILYKLPAGDVHGRDSIVLTPFEFLDRLCQLTPPPRVHRHRYHGVIAPNSPLRARVIASAGPAAALQKQLEEAASRMGIRAAGGDLCDHSGADRNSYGTGCGARSGSQPEQESHARATEEEPSERRGIRTRGDCR